MSRYTAISLEERRSKRLRREPLLRCIEPSRITLPTPVRAEDAAVCLYDLAREYAGRYLHPHWHWLGLRTAPGFLGWRPMRRRWVRAGMILNFHGPLGELSLYATFDALSGQLVKFTYYDEAEFRWRRENELFGPVEVTASVLGGAAFRDAWEPERETEREPDCNVERAMFIESILRQQKAIDARRLW